MFRRLSAHDRLAQTAAPLRGHAVRAVLNASRENAETLSRLRNEATMTVARALRLLFGEALPLAPERVTTVVTQALAPLAGAYAIQIRVHADDHQRVTNAMAEYAGVDVSLSAEVARGGCTLHTEDADVDATVETLLQAALELARREIAP